MPASFPTHLVPPGRQGFLTLALAVSLLSSCATTDHKVESAQIGAVIGCLGGAVISVIIKGNPASACAIGAVAGGLAGYQKARLEELRQARAAAAEVAALGATPPPAVQTQQVQVYDVGGKSVDVEAFKAFQVDVPVSQLETPEGKTLMRKLGAYAHKVADERSEPVKFDLAEARAEATPPQVVLDEQPEQAGRGIVFRRRLADVAVSSTVLRVTIETRNPPSILPRQG